MAVTWPPDTFGGCCVAPLRQAGAGPADAGKVEGEAEGEAERPAAGARLAADVARGLG
jgi:hypothetical protein